MIQTVPKMLKSSASKWPAIPAQYFKDDTADFRSFSYTELFEKSLDFAAGLLDLGETTGEKKRKKRRI